MEISELEYGDDVTSFEALCLNIENRTTKSGSPYAALSLRDSEKQIDGRYWDGHLDSDLNGPVRVDGTVDKYDGNLQIAVQRIKDLDKSPEKFYPKLPRSFDSYFEIALSYMPEENHEIGRITRSILKNHEKEFKAYPAASSNHHAYPGGLVQHVCSMLSLSERVVDSIEDEYAVEEGKIDRNLIYCATALHDVGKIYEFSSPTGGYCEFKSKIGHIPKANELIEDNRIREEESESEKERIKELKHAVLSHHGRKEWGSPVEPQTIEAKIVNQVDMFDSRLKPMLDGIDSS